MLAFSFFFVSFDVNLCIVFISLQVIHWTTGLNTVRLYNEEAGEEKDMDLPFDQAENEANPLPDHV